MRLNVNTDALIGLTARLEGMHRSAFPSAVRNTLNDAAFEAKKNIPETARGKFTIRQQNLFRTFSGVNKAAGFDVNRMKSQVGLDASKPKSDELIEGLSAQETGGTIQGRKLIAHDKARIGSSNAKKVSRKNLLSNIRSFSKKGKRVKGSKYVLIKQSAAKGTLFEANKGKLKPLYNYINNRARNLKKRSFILPAALKASKRMDAFYIKNANRQFQKYMNR